MQYDGMPPGYAYDDRYDWETNRAIAAEQENALLRERRASWRDHSARRRLLVKLLRERAGRRVEQAKILRWPERNYLRTLDTIAWCLHVAERIEKGPSDD